MKILVPVKRVVDYNVKIRLKSDGSGVDLANVKMSMNPFDEIAVEEALRQKEAGKATEVIVVSIGPAQAAETLRTALAMGADRGVLIKAEGIVEPLAVAKLLKGVVEAEQPGLVILGKQAIDDDSNQTGQMLAALLGWGQGTFASKIVIEGERVAVTREVRPRRWPPGACFVPRSPRSHRENKGVSRIVRRWRPNPERRPCGFASQDGMTRPYFHCADRRQSSLRARFDAR